MTNQQQQNENLNVDLLKPPKPAMWWINDSTYHDDVQLNQKQFKTYETPAGLDSRQPYTKIVNPEPVYVSQQLHALMKEIVPPDAQELFAVRATEPVSLKMDIKTGPRPDLPPVDPNDPSEPPSHLTDESFERKAGWDENIVCDDDQDCNAVDTERMVHEVDQHLKYLRDRLGRLQWFGEDAIRERERKKTYSTKPVPSLETGKKAISYQEVPTVDPVGFQNTKIVQKLEREIYKPSLYDLQCVKKIDGKQLKIPVKPRSAGGAHTAMVRRMSQAPRPRARMLPRGAPEPHPDALKVTSLGPPDARIQAINYGLLDLSLPEFGLSSLEAQLIKKQLDQKQNQSSNDPTSLDFPPELLSQPPENPFLNKLEDKVEVNLAGDQGPQLIHTAQILAQLRADERHLRELLREYREEQTRPPEDQWWERKDGGFGRELYQNRVHNAANNSPAIDVDALAEHLLRTSYNLDNPVETKDAGV